MSTEPDALTPTPRTSLRQLPKRGSYERAEIDAVLDEAYICHLGFVLDGQPFVIPTIHARVGTTLYVHGAAASRMLRTLAQGVPVCVTVSLLDGLVLARSAFHHSMNYRSVMVLGTAREVQDPAERVLALQAVVEHVLPGRWSEVRAPNERELSLTSVLALPIDEASAKIRTGPPIDDEEDYALSCWAGVLPLRITPGAPLADERMVPGTPLPSGVKAYRRGV